MTLSQLLIGALGKTALLFVSGLLLTFAVAGFERRASPLSMGRSAPTPFQLTWIANMLSLVVDACKLACKTDHVPSPATRTVFVLAPVWALCCAIVLGGLMPLAAPLCADAWLSAVPPQGCEHVVNVQVLPHADGLLLFVALTLLSSFSMAMAGWASHNNWALLASLRTLFQTMAFAVPMGLGVLSVAVMSGTFSLVALVEAQGEWPWQWGIWGVPHVLAFVVMWMALVVGVPRNPFHFDDGRSEVLGGLVEYSGLRAAAFRWAELLRTVFSGALVVSVFFGGWRFPGLTAASESLPNIVVVGLSWVAWLVKVTLVCGLQMLARGSVARPRPDQVLDIVWRRIMPLGFFALIAATLWRVLGQGAWP